MFIIKLEKTGKAAINVLIIFMVLLTASCLRHSESPDSSLDYSITSDNRDSHNIQESEIEKPFFFNFDLNRFHEKSLSINLDNYRLEDNILKMTSKNVYQNDPMIIFELPEVLDMQKAINQYRWFSLEMSIDSGNCMWLIANIENSKEARGITIPIVPNLEFNRYSVDLEPLYEAIKEKYSSRAVITKWALIVSDRADSNVEIKTMTFGSIPFGSPLLSVNINLEDTKEIFANSESSLVLNFTNIGKERTEPASVKIGSRLIQLPSISPGQSYREIINMTFHNPGIHELIFEFENQKDSSLKVTAYDSNTDSYVPKPVPATSEYNIGAFYYGGWFDQATWNPILPFLDRKPYLGWYESGDTAAMDWQIKWAAENAISFFTFCWYRKAGTPEDPVGADIPYNDAVNKALPNARYKDYIKYAIMWCNNNGHPVKMGARDYDEFMEVLVPFWMEEYFKDSNYLKIDNKPVFYLWQVKEFVSDMGGIEKASQALDAMNNYAIENGFDGIYLIGNYYYQSPASQISKEIGIDIAYYYITPIDTNASTDIVERQSFHLNIRDKQAKAAGMTWLPSASVGLDYLGWNLSRPVERWLSTPDIYADVLKMNKEYIDKQNISERDKRMIMLSVWDEYGEGHFITPSNKYGFDYLTAVHNVFGTSSAPVNIKPEELGLNVNQIFTGFEEENNRIIHYWPLKEEFLGR